MASTPPATLLAAADGGAKVLVGGMLLMKGRESSQSSVKKVGERDSKEAERALKTDKDFKRWFHKDYKPRVKTGSSDKRNPDMSAERLRDAYEEYLKGRSARVK